MEQITNREQALDLIGELVERYYIDRGELMSTLHDNVGIRTRGDLIFQVREANTLLMIATRDILPHMKDKLRNGDIPEILCKTQQILQAVLSEFMAEDLAEIAKGG